MKLYQIYNRKERKFVSLEFSKYNNDFFGNGGKVWTKLSHIKKHISYRKNYYHEYNKPENFVIVEYEINPTIERTIDIKNFETLSIPEQQ